jgi:adenylate cyclase
MRGLHLGGRLLSRARCEIAILFADIRGSTALEERIEPEDATVLLNEFFEAMDDEIERFNGTLDKYLGELEARQATLPMDS